MRSRLAQLLVSTAGRPSKFVPVVAATVVITPIPYKIKSALPFSETSPRRARRTRVSITSALGFAPTSLFPLLVLCKRLRDTLRLSRPSDDLPRCASVRVAPRPRHTASRPLIATGSSSNSMSGDKGKALPIPPPSPAFALTSSWTPSAASRPEHSAVAIPLESTTPLIPPPETPQVTAGGGFGDEKYSAYGDVNAGGGEGDALLRRRSDEFDDDESRRKGHRAVSPLETLVRLLLGMFAILGFLVLLARLSVLPEHQTARVAAYMPSPVRGLIQVVEGPTEAHPIIPLIREAREKWHKKLTSQSWTFDRATRTYKSRYGRAPPPGFDKWFAFATQGRNHSLVDEYDQLMEDLEPFRALSAAELRRRTAELSKVPGISIVSIRNGEAQVHARSSSWAPADAFQRMLAAFVRDLPDMDIAINERPEGRVLPRQQRHVFMSDYGLEGEELVASE